MFTFFSFITPALADVGHITERAGHNHLLLWALIGAIVSIVYYVYRRT